MDAVISPAAYESYTAVVGLDCLKALGDACAAVTSRLRKMSQPERDFWTDRAYQATDRKTRKHQESYGRWRGTWGQSQWRRVLTENVEEA